MAQTLNGVIAALPKAERTRLEARTREPVAEERSLRELRKANDALGEDPEAASGAGAP